MLGYCLYKPDSNENVDQKSTNQESTIQRVRCFITLNQSLKLDEYTEYEVGRIREREYSLRLCDVGVCVARNTEIQ